MRRPMIAIPGRFSESASALRYRAVVNARKLLDAVYDAGGEPVTVYPRAPLSVEDMASRLWWADGLLLPGGGDLARRLRAGTVWINCYEEGDMTVPSAATNRAATVGTSPCMHWRSTRN